VKQIRWKEKPRTQNCCSAGWLRDRRTLPPHITGLSALALVLVTASLSAAQTPVTLSGRVVTAANQAGVFGVTLELGPRSRVITGQDGEFQFRGIAPGSYTLSVIGLGYARQQIPLQLDADTTIVIELARAPVVLDTLAILGRTITVDGRVEDKATGIALLDVEVIATPPDRRAVTDRAGRFKLDRMPAGSPITVNVRELGYQWPTFTIVSDRDTTLEFVLEPDSVAAAVIAEQKQAIGERAGDLRYPFDSVIDREELLRSRNGSVKDALERILGKARMARVACVVINERMSRDFLLETMSPDRLEYIDVLWFGPTRRLLMVRVYTREFFAQLIGGRDLVSQEAIAHAMHTGECR
jgi:hypothetical protein